MGMIIQNGKVFSGEPKTTYTERVLWNGSETPALSPGTDITLSDDLYSYDEIVFKTYNPTYSQYAILPFTTSLIDIEITYMSIINTVIGLGVCFTVNSGNSIKIKRISSGSEAALTYTKIVGIKYGDTVKVPSITLNDITDVDTTGKSNNDCLRYNSTSGKWEADTVTANDIYYSSGVTVKTAIDDKKTNDVSVTAAPNFLFDGGLASEVLGTVVMTMAIKGTYITDTWSTVATTSAPPASKLRVPAVCVEDGQFGGMVEINTNGSIRIYPRPTGEYTLSFTAAYKKHS